MKNKINIEMHGGIHGTMTCLHDDNAYKLPVEYTGDYSKGIYISISELDKQIKSQNSKQIKSQVLRNIRSWAKETENKVCW